MSKVQPPVRIRATVRTTVEGRRTGCSSWNGVTKELQGELGRGIFLVWALVGCPGLRLTLWSWLGLREIESQELQLVRDMKEAPKGEGGLQREHGWEEFLVWALAGELGLSIWFHIRVRVESEPRAAVGVGYERVQPSVSSIVKVCVGRRILGMQL